MSSKKITLLKGQDCELLFDSHHGIHNLRSVFDLAKRYGYKGKWIKGKDCENCEDAEQYLNNHVCDSCQIEWHEDVWIVREGYDLENGCDYPGDDNENKEWEEEQLWEAQPTPYDL